MEDFAARQARQAQAFSVDFAISALMMVSYSRWRRDRQVGGTGSVEDAVDGLGGTSKEIQLIRAIRDEAVFRRIFPIR